MIDPYARIPRLYDAELSGGQSADCDFFAREVGAGSVLVVGCGTGRVARALGPRKVVGVDVSAPMLAQARAASPDGTWLLGDARALPVSGPFDTVVFPHGVFAFLATRADQAAALGEVARVLRPGGTLWIDVPMPDFALLGTPWTPETPAWEGQLDGVPVRRTREVRRAPVAQKLDLIDRWYVGDDPPLVSHLPLRLVFPDELAWMLEGAGFWVDAIYGDYAGRPLSEGCPRLCVRAGK